MASIAQNTKGEREEIWIQNQREKKIIIQEKQNKEDKGG